MAVKVDCPQCSVRLRVRDSLVGAQVRCPACKRSFEAKPIPVAGQAMVRTEGEHALFEDVDPSARRGAWRSPLAVGGVRVPTFQTGVFALGITILLAILVKVVVPDGALARLFSHGLISFFTALLSIWAVCILLIKARRLAFEKRALRFDVLSQEEDEVIRPDNVHHFMAHIQELPEKMRASILFRRISRALEYFRSTGSMTGVSAYLASQNDLDVSASDSSYTMVRAFIWAVPILGFIGTVFGIGEAVNSFAVSVDAATDVEAIRTSLGGVTGGLGTAFETTLVALVVSILLMIPTNWLQKTEDDLLTSIGSYCNEELVWRFERAPGVGPDGVPAAGAMTPEGLSGAISQAVDHAGELAKVLRTSVESVNAGLDASVEKLNNGLPTAIMSLSEKVDRSFEATGEMLEAQHRMREQFTESASGESVESLMVKLNDTHRRMTEVLERMATMQPRRWWRLWA